TDDVYGADTPPQDRPVTVLYHILANDRWGNEVRDPSSGDYQVQVHSISEPIGGGPAGMDANALGFLVAVPAGIFGALLLVAWVLRSRKHCARTGPPGQFRKPVVPGGGAG